MPNKILLKGDPIRKEGQAKSAVTPGELLEWSADDKLQAHSGAGAEAQKMFCIEEAFTGDGIDTDYAVDDTVQYVVPRRGDEINAFLAAGQNVAKGDPLESDGAGALQAHTAQTVDPTATSAQTVNSNPIVAYAHEDQDNSGGTARVRIKVEVA